MSGAFDFTVSPFDCLSQDEQRLVQDSVDIAYFPSGDLILERGAAPTHLFIIIKGFVQQLEGGELVHTYGPEDSFDARSLMSGKVSGRFVAAEEVVAYQLARQAVSELIASNAGFSALLFSDLSNKLSALAERESRHELQSLTMARVDEAFVRPPQFVDAQTSVLDVVRQFHAQRTTTVLVRDARADPPALGIFTVTGLQRAVLDGRPLDQLAVGELANFSLIRVRPGDALADALAVMIRAKVHRVVVAEGAQVLGVLEALDLFSFLSNHSYLINVQILDAQDLAALKIAALHINRLIALLHQGGTKVQFIARLVQELNAKLFERAWQLLAPPDLVANSCLFVMGSEGRGEQLLKTDQDNGLVLRDGYTPPADLATICDSFSSALAAFGYPLCPGGIMLSKPAWRHSVADFSRQARLWWYEPTDDHLMALAIFLDAQSVAGDASLLDAVRSAVFAAASDDDVSLARFADAVNFFSAANTSGNSNSNGNGSGWWDRLRLLGEARHDALDLKKAGIFPLVHGVRSLALAHRVRATSTASRVEALCAAGHLSESMGVDLMDSLHFFMTLRLRAGLAGMQSGRLPADRVTVEQLSSLDRDLLRDTLAVVKKFKALLRQRFHLDAL